MENKQNISLRSSKNYYLMKTANLKNIKGYYYPNNFKCFLTSKDFNIFENLSKRDKKIQAKILDKLMRKIIIEKIIKKINDHNLLNNNIIKLTEKIEKVKKVEKVKKEKEDKKIANVYILNLKGNFKIIQEKKIKPKDQNVIKKINYEKKLTTERINQLIWLANEQELKYPDDLDLLILIENYKGFNVENIFEKLNIIAYNSLKSIFGNRYTISQSEDLTQIILSQMFKAGINVSIKNIIEVLKKFYSFGGFKLKNGKISKTLIMNLQAAKLISNNNHKKDKWLSDLEYLDTFRMDEYSSNYNFVWKDEFQWENDEKIEHINKKEITADTAVLKFIDLRKKGCNSRNYKQYNISYRQYMNLRDAYKGYKLFLKENI